MKPLMLITGSSGLIGSALCRHFAERFRVVGFDREGGAYPPDIVDWLFVDVGSDESLQTGMHILEQRYGLNVESVLHLAAYYDFAGRPSKLYDKITVQGTKRFLRELQRFDVNQFIFSSTMLVHKPGKPDEKITEDSPVQPTWDYPKSKIRTEKLIHEDRGNIPAVNLRIAGVYDDYCHSIPIAQQIQRLFEGEITGRFYPGDIESAQSFIHLDDLVGAFEHAVARRKELPPELALLIGEDDALAYGEMQKIIADELNRGDWLLPIPKPVAKLGAAALNVLPGEQFIQPWMIDRTDDSYNLDISKAERYLNWRPQRRLRDELPRIIQRLKDDPLTWYRENKLKPPDWLQRRSA